jgi:hypothetical protein
MYKRFFKAHIGLGHIEEANYSLKKAIEMDPNDSTNRADQNMMDEVLH